MEMPNLLMSKTRRRAQTLATTLLAVVYLTEVARGMLAMVLSKSALRRNNWISFSSGRQRLQVT
jgi:hypothetical protein